MCTYFCIKIISRTLENITFLSQNVVVRSKMNHALCVWRQPAGRKLASCWNHHSDITNQSRHCNEHYWTWFRTFPTKSFLIGEYPFVKTLTLIRPDQNRSLNLGVRPFTQASTHSRWYDLHGMSPNTFLPLTCFQTMPDSLFWSILLTTLETLISGALESSHYQWPGVSKLVHFQIWRAYTKAGRMEDAPRNVMVQAGALV